MRNRPNSVIVGLVCLLLLGFTCRILIEHLDYFVNGKEASGEIINKVFIKNKIYVSIQYFNENSGQPEIVDMKYSINYKQEIEGIYGRSFVVIYSKWFKQLYIKDIREPKILVLFLELGLVVFFLIVVMFSVRSIFLKSNVSDKQVS